MLVALGSCDFSKSVHKDLQTGMVTRGNGLSCDEVYLTVNEEVYKSKTFTFGETFYVNFSNISGFNRVDGAAFPGMSIRVTGQDGSVIIDTDDAYDQFSGGFPHDPLLLSANLDLGAPMRSDAEYHLEIRIWDKQEEERVFSAEMDFHIIPNVLLEVEKVHLSCYDIYLYSQQRDQAVTDGRIGLNETIHVIFNGLNGFIEEDGFVYPEINMQIENADGEVLARLENLVGDDYFTPVEIKEVFAACHFQISDQSLKNPITYRMELFDKKGEGKISLLTKLEVDPEFSVSQ